MTTSTPISLREKNRLRLRSQIVEATTALLGEMEFTGFTADDIAARAEVARATFFRYFDSKDAAVVAAFYEQRFAALVAVMNAAPAELGPVDAIIWAFTRLEENFSQQRAMILFQAKMVAASPGLRAKALEYQARYSQAIADAVAPRYGQLGPHDLRPRLLSVTTLMVVTSTIDYWADGNSGLSLPLLVNTALLQMKSGFSADKGKPVVPKT
ncbi:MAG: TetR family transcriptional regulator [Stagnimonas sp.]|nr:TetR family transcriptional regulator [Stagnimonas sp.]